MASSGPSKRLKKLASEIPSDGVIREMLTYLSSDNIEFADHAIAMIGASFVDKALEVAIRAHLRPMDDDALKRLFQYDHNGPIADLSARIKIADALSVFGPKTRTDLDLIREVRNAFGHAVKYLRFETPEVSEMCMALHMPNWVTILGSTGVDRKTARGRYIESTVAMGERLKSSLLHPPQNMLLQPRRALAQQRLLP